MNSQGTGKIRLVCSAGLNVLSKFGNVIPLSGSVNGARSAVARYFREIHPLQEMSYFVASDTDHDFQNFHIPGLLGHGGVEWLPPCSMVPK